MFRAFIEFLFIVLVVIIARAVLTSIMKGVANASSSAFRAQMQSSAGKSGDASPPPSTAGDLHKDPICGTYVAESTPFRQNILGQIFYYCSESCREKHALAVR